MARKRPITGGGLFLTERGAHVTFTSRHIIAETGRRPNDMAILIENIDLCAPLSYLYYRRYYYQSISLLLFIIVDV